ncbi:MAG: DUF2892 domain-containing protein [Balneolaceae bacterium]
MANERMQSKTKLHDGIVGIIYLVSIILAVTINIQWLYLAGVVAVLQIMSMFTGFCPVYYILNKFIPDRKPASGIV